MVTLDTLRALREHEHQLAAYCVTCERWAVLDPERLIAEPRCIHFGSKGRWITALPVLGCDASKRVPPA